MTVRESASEPHTLIMREDGSFDVEHPESCPTVTEGGETYRDCDVEYTDLEDLMDLTGALDDLDDPHAEHLTPGRYRFIFWSRVVENGDLSTDYEGGVRLVTDDKND